MGGIGPICDVGSVSNASHTSVHTMPYTQQDLDLARRHLDEAARQIHHQRYLVDQLCRARYDTSAAEELLRILERTHKDLVELRDKIATGLAQFRCR